MAVSLKHTTQAVGTDAGNGEIRKAQWNEEHALTLATNSLIGRYSSGTGAAQEIAIGSGLTVTGGTLNATAAGGVTNITFQTNVTDFKDSVKAATTANITISNPGTSTFDGVTLTSGDRILVKNQSTGSQNGIYIFNGSSSALTRATDADEDAEVTSGMLVLCEGGSTQSNTLFSLTTPDPITVGTTSLTFASIVLPSNPEIVSEITAASYTLVTTDPNKWLKMNRATAQTVTVPGSSTKIPVNSVIYLQQYGAGIVTLAAAGGVTIRAPQGLSTATQYSVIRLKKIGTSEWSAIITGGNASVASVKPFIVFKPVDNEPPTSNFATLDTRNNHPVLNFDTTTQESAIFSGVLPLSYAGGGLTVDAYWAAATATTGTVGWDVAIERIDASSLDIDADSFASAKTITAATVPGTSGQILVTSVVISSGANMDSLAAGEAFRVRIRRDVANDTATGDAQLLRLVVRET